MSQNNGDDEIVFKSIKELVSRRIEEIEEKHKKMAREQREERNWREEKSGIITAQNIMTGFCDIDKETNGLPTGISVIGARPEDGLVDFSLNIALNASETHKVGYVSPNLPSEILMKRLIAMKSGVSLRNVNEGFLAERDFPKLTGAAGYIFNASERLTLYDSPDLTPERFRKVCEKLKDSRGAQLIILNRFQSLFPIQSSINESGYWKAKEILGTLDDITKEMGLSLLVLSEVKKKARNERLGLEHLRDFGILEYNARPIMMLQQREPYYDDADCMSSHSVVEIFNNYEGDISTSVQLTYFKGHCKFETATRVSDEDI